MGKTDSHRSEIKGDDRYRHPHATALLSLPDLCWAQQVSRAAARDPTSVTAAEG